MPLKELQEMENLKRFKESQDVKIDWKSILDSESYNIVMSQCEELSCAAELVLFPMLISVAHFMGTKATVKIDTDWTEPTSLMCLLVARRGERKTCALQRTKQSCTVLEKEIRAMEHLNREGEGCSDDKVISLIDEHNIQTDLNKTLKCSEGNPLIIIDDFKETLDTIENSSDIFTNAKLKEIYGCGMENQFRRHMNFVGTIQALDVHCVFENRDRIAMFDRALIVCCKNFAESTKDTTGETNSTQTILSSVRNFHSVQSDQTYTFNSGGQAEFSRCLGIFQRMKKMYVDNKMVFGSINQAGGHLARLSAILTALRNGVAMGNNSAYLPSRIIDKETVKRAYQIVRFIVQQKLCLFASKADDEWPEIAEDNQNTTWATETDNQSEKSIHVTTTGNYADEYEDDVMEISQNGGRVDRIIAGKNEIPSKSFVNDYYADSPHQSYPENEMVVVKNRYPPPPSNMHDVTFSNGKPEMDNRLMQYFVPITSSVPQMSRSMGPSQMEAHGSNIPSISDSPNMSHIPSPKPTVVHSNVKQRGKKTFRASHKCLLPPYEGCVFDADDEVFFQQCANKIKKLLLTHGAVVTASYACQYRLFPPVPMDMRQKSPRTSHPSWAASRFFERLEGLEIGTMHVLRGHSVRFLKETYVKMSDRGKDLLKRLRILQEEYEETFPESTVFDELKLMQMKRDNEENIMNDIVFNNQ